MTTEQIREKLKAYMSPKRFLHTVGVEEAAISLTNKFGLDKEKTSKAALLHDITKELSTNEHLRLCEENGIVLDEVEKNEPKILHPITGAIIAKRDFGILDEEILRAIRYHTTARTKMSQLEKIIFMADFIEPYRDFDGVEIIRQKTEEDFEQGFLYALIFSICDVSQKKKMIHINSLEAMNEQILNLRLKGE